MPIKEIEDILSRIRSIHIKKNEDYASAGNEFENFERSEELMSWFKTERDKTHIWPIGTKIARLATLLNNEERKPNNESIDDSFLDLTVYCILWWAHYQRINSLKAQSVEVTNKPEFKSLPYKCRNCNVIFYHSPCYGVSLSDMFCSDRCRGEFETIEN